MCVSLWLYLWLWCGRGVCRDTLRNPCVCAWCRHTRGRFESTHATGRGSNSTDFEGGQSASEIFHVRQHCCLAFGLALPLRRAAIPLDALLPLSHAALSPLRARLARQARRRASTTAMAISLDPREEVTSAEAAMRMFSMKACTRRTSETTLQCTPGGKTVPVTTRRRRADVKP